MTPSTASIFINDSRCGIPRSITKTRRLLLQILQGISIRTILKNVSYEMHNWQRDHYDDVMVIAYDLLDRNFQIGEDKLTHPKKYAEIQQSLLKVHVKVMAHFARLKIRASATSLNGLLPEQIQHQGPRAEQDPIYGWLNLTKIRWE